MLYRDIYLSGASSSGAQVGTVTYKNRYAEQKNTGSNLWGALAQNAPVFNEDTIRTGSGSSATIHLDNKTEITLGEDSMVFIDLSRKKGHAETFRRLARHRLFVGVPGRRASNLLGRRNALGGKTASQRFVRRSPAGRYRR